MIQDYRGKRAKIAATAYVHPSAVLIGEIEIAEESSIWPNATLRGDDGPIYIGRQTSIQDGTVIHCTEGLSLTRVGDRVTVGHNVILHGCTIADECLIGMGSIVMDNARVEAGAILGAGTVVPGGKIVPAHTVVVGNPFRVVRECTDRDLELLGFSWRSYVKRAREYRGAT